MLRSSFTGARQFLRDKRGNVAIVAALAMGPICLAGLGAADLARGTSAKSQLQDALDAAALGAARTNATTDAELQTAGDRFLAQNLAGVSDDLHLASSSFSFGENGRVIASAQLDVTPFIAGMLSDGVMHIRASTEVVRAEMKVEIAMVLDTTGSMDEGTKLADMKKAAKEFVDSMEVAADKSTEPDAVRISLVPFANAVRLDADTYRYSMWIDQNGIAPVNDEIFTTSTGTQHANRFNLFSQLNVSWRGCVEMRQAPYDIQDTPPVVGTPATLYTPYFAVDEPDSRTSGYGSDYQNDYLPDNTNSSNWRVRQGMINKYGGNKKSSMTTSFGPNRGCGVAKMKRLSTDFDAIRSAIASLNASGNTNIPIGLAWGWNTLAPAAPFSDGVAYNTPKYKKIIILMTDGENTMDQRDTPNDGSYASTGYIWQGRVLQANGSPLPQGASNSARTNALNSRLSKLCDNIKAKGIELYTVRVEVSTGDSTLLKNCATANDYYYDVSDSENLTSVFQSIAGQIAALHLSK